DRVANVERRLAQIEEALPRMLGEGPADPAAIAARVHEEAQRVAERLGVDAQKLAQRVAAAESLVAGVEKVSAREARLEHQVEELAAALAAIERRLESPGRRGAADESGHGSRAQMRRSTAIDAFADGLRGDFRARAE